MSSTAPAAATGRSRDLTAPPRHRDRLLAWLLLSGCVALAAGPMLVLLREADVVVSAEAVTIATSAETWRSRAEQPDERWHRESWAPVFNQEPMLEAAPGVTWLHLLAFWDLPNTAPPDALIYRARLVSVAFGLLTVVAVFWAGLSIGSLATGSFAALVCLANPVMLLQSRLATDTMPHVGLAMLSISAALWAARPLKPPASRARQAIGWALCGLVLGLTVLTAGPPGAVTVLGPLFLILLLCPQRIAHLFGLIASVFIAALMITPWALYVHEQNLDAWQAWLFQLVPEWQDPTVFGGLAAARLLLFVAAMLPWTLWIIGGIVQPLSTSSRGARQRMFIGWVWLASVAVWLLIAPGLGELQEVILALPVTAILIGQLFRQLADLSAEGRHTRVWRLLRWPHLVLIFGVSLVIPIVLHFQSVLVDEPWLPTTLMNDSVPWWFSAGLGVVLVGLTILSLRLAVRHYPARALTCWAVWTVLAVGVLMIPLSRGPLFQSSAKREGTELAALVGTDPIYFMPTETDDSTVVETTPSLPFLMLYAGRTLPVKRAAEIDLLLEQNYALFLLAPAGDEPSGSWAKVRDLAAMGATLWRPTGREGSAPLRHLQTSGSVDSAAANMVSCSQTRHGWT